MTHKPVLAQYRTEGGSIISGKSKKDGAAAPGTFSQVAARAVRPLTTTMAPAPRYPVLTQYTVVDGHIICQSELYAALPQ